MMPRETTASGTIHLHAHLTGITHATIAAASQITKAASPNISIFNAP